MSMNMSESEYEGMEQAMDQAEEARKKTTEAKSLVDPDMKLLRPVDPAFEQGTGEVRICERTMIRACTAVEKMVIPTIDVDANPDVQKVIHFVMEMKRFKAEKKEELMPVMMKAFQGAKGKSWCAITGYDMEKTLNLLLNWMMQRDDWFALSNKLEKGDPLSDDLIEHIILFRNVAMYKGMHAESEQTKRLFIKALRGFPIEAARNKEGQFKSFDEIVQMAMDNKKTFETAMEVERLLRKQRDELAAAAAAMKRPRDDDDEYRRYGRPRDDEEVYRRYGRERPRPGNFDRNWNRTGWNRRVENRKQAGPDTICHRCLKKGHFARDCRTLMPGDKQERSEERKQDKKTGKKQDKARGRAQACTATKEKGPEKEYFSGDSDSE